MSKKFDLFAGTLVLKARGELRTAEREHQVPSFKLGSMHVIWWSRSNERRHGRRPGPLAKSRA